MFSCCMCTKTPKVDEIESKELNEDSQDNLRDDSDVNTPGSEGQTAVLCSEISGKLTEVSRDIEDIAICTDTDDHKNDTDDDIEKVEIICDDNDLNNGAADDLDENNKICNDNDYNIDDDLDKKDPTCNGHNVVNDSNKDDILDLQDAIDKHSSLTEDKDLEKGESICKDNHSDNNTDTPIDVTPNNDHHAIDDDLNGIDKVCDDNNLGPVTDDHLDKVDEIHYDTDPRHGIADEVDISNDNDPHDDNESDDDLDDDSDKVDTICNDNDVDHNNATDRDIEKIDIISDNDNDNNDTDHDLDKVDIIGNDDDPDYNNDTDNDNIEKDVEQLDIAFHNDPDRNYTNNDAINDNHDDIDNDNDDTDNDKRDDLDEIEVVESKSVQFEINIAELPPPLDIDELEKCMELESEKLGPKRGCLFEAPGYIERTIKDGPDEDGDDSVFESSVPAHAAAEPVDRPRAIIRWLSEEDDDTSEIRGGMQEPPATPIAKDELALRRHRFFSDLMQASNNSGEHRVRFDPLGPLIHPGCDTEREDQLEQLVTRLENVTSRLEVLPARLFTLTQEAGVQTQNSSPKISDRSSPDTISLESVVELGSRDSADSNLTPFIMSIVDYEDIVNGPVAEFMQLSQKIGSEVAAHGKLVEKSFQLQLDFLRMATTRCAPANQSEQMALLTPTSQQIQAIQEYREKNRGSQFFNHLSAISESIPALGWVAVAQTPGPYIKEMNDAGQFYTNRVLKDWKEKNKTHVDWCKAWVQTLTDLQKYVKQHHTTGLVWAKTGSAPPPPPPGAMPPPPPCMPMADLGEALGNDDRSALFAQINQGENITKSLKKVTSDMQTHKNSSLRTGPAPFKAPVVTNSSSPMKSVPSANLPIDKPPVFTRDGKKWLIEYHKGNKDLLIDNSEMNNVVYMYRCQDCSLIVKGKINSIVMDSCRKSSIVFDSVVSSIEFVNCLSVQMQVLGKVPTISIDKTDGCQMYLSPESLQVELITSKSSEMNVMVPKGNGDYSEYPVPEQFKTTISAKGLSTTAVDALG